MEVSNHEDVLYKRRNIPRKQLNFTPQGATQKKRLSPMKLKL